MNLKEIKARLMIRQAIRDGEASFVLSDDLASLRDANDWLWDAISFLVSELDKDSSGSRGPEG